MATFPWMDYGGNTNMLQSGGNLMERPIPFSRQPQAAGYGMVPQTEWVPGAAPAAHSRETGGGFGGFGGFAMPRYMPNMGGGVLSRPPAPTSPRGGSSGFFGPQVAPSIGSIPNITGSFGVSAPNVSAQNVNPWAGPNIAATPIWNPQQMNARVNQMSAGNAAETQGRVNRMQAGLASRGYGANSPLAASIASQMGAQNLMGTTGAENDLRWNAAQGNAEQLLRGQMAQEQQAGRMDANAQFNSRNALQAALANQSAALQGSEATAGNALDVALANQRSQQGNVGNQLTLGLQGMQPAQIDALNRQRRIQDTGGYPSTAMANSIWANYGLGGRPHAVGGQPAMYG